MSQRATAAKTTESKSSNPPVSAGKATIHSQISPYERILHLQSAVGNRAVQRMYESGVLQAKLKLGQPGDKYEHEADRVAERVTSMPEPDISRQEDEEVQTKPLADQITPLVQKQPEDEEETAQAKILQRQPEEEEPVQTKLLQRQQGEEEEEEMQTRPMGPSPQTGKLGIQHMIASLDSGSPLSENVKSRVEPVIGADLRHVRVHSDTSANVAARLLNAKAFTHKHHIWLGRGENAGDVRLMAHEVTHVLQQDGIVRRKPKPEVEEEQREKLAEEKGAMPIGASATEAAYTEETRITETSSATATEAAASVAPSEVMNKTALPETVPPGKPTPATPPRAKAEIPPTEAAPAQPEVKAETATAIATPEAEVVSKVPAETTPKAVAPTITEAGPSTGAPSKPGGPEISAPSPEPQIDTSSSEGLLQSLATVPPSASAQALEKACAEAPGIQVREKAELEASFPTVERPTGLPRKSKEKPRKQTVLEKGKAPEPAEETGRKGKPLETGHKEAFGPVPGSKVSTDVTEPREEEGVNWWKRLINRIKVFISSLPTRDQGVSTSAGPRPHVDLSGEANPQQNIQNKKKSDQEVNSRLAQADIASGQDFGENDIYPDVPVETLHPTYKPVAPPAGPTGPGKGMPGLTGRDRAMFDQTASSWYTSQINEEQGKYQLEQEGYRKRSLEVREEGQRRIAEETALTRAEQEAMQEQARSDVNGERQRWREQNRKIQENYMEKSESKRKEIDHKISEKVKSAETESDQKMTQAEAKAEAERLKTERRAEEEKRKAEKPRSLWQRAKGAISSAFKALKKFVSSIFDALRKFVKETIEAVKAVVRGIIELARKAIVGFIRLLGEALKGLVTIALAAFPEAAEKARNWIDKRVDQAVDAVNKAAEALKKATDAILDFVGEVLDTALSVVQKVFNAILSVIEFLVVGLMEIMECIWNLVSAARQMPDYFWGQMSLELTGKDLTKPLPGLERTGKPGSGTPEEWPAQAGLSPEDRALLGKDSLSAGDVVIDPVPEIELEPELIDLIAGREDDEIFFGESGGGDFTIDELRAMVGYGSAGQEPATHGRAVEPTGEPDFVGMTDEQKMDYYVSQMNPPCSEMKGEPPKGESDNSIPDVAKVGPLTVSQRLGFVMKQMKKGISNWWECNKVTIIAITVAALLALAIAAFFTGGAAILAAIKAVMLALTIIFGAVLIAKMGYYFGMYVRKAWGGDLKGGAEALARAIAVGAVELVFNFIFKVGGVLLKMVKRVAKTIARLAKAAGKTAVRGVRTGGRLLLRGGRALGRGMVQITRRIAAPVLRQGKVFFRGIKTGFAKGVKTLGKLGRKLKRHFGFRGFSLKVIGSRFFLYGHFNPKVLLANGRIREFTEAVKKRLKGPRSVGHTLTFRYGAKGTKMKGMIIPDELAGRLAKMRPAERAREFRKLLRMNVPRRRLVMHVGDERIADFIIKRGFHPKTNVPFVKTSKGWFPKFKSYKTVKLKPSDYKKTRPEHFQICNKELHASILKRPALGRKLGIDPNPNSSVMRDLAQGKNPRGFTWHHHQDPGKLQLVNSGIHAQTGHSGGYSIWAQ